MEGGPDIQTGVPNVTFAQGQRGNNVTIRGIGTKAFSGASDSATGIHFNGAPMSDNRLFEMDLYDIERLEVLRGPQGALYGRNATGGVINVISAKPKGEFAADLNAEYGSFETRKFRGMVNIPLAGDQLGIRLAASHFDRAGLATNTVNGEKLDSRHMSSFRATLGFQPSDSLHGYITWQRFREDDTRLLTGKGACVADPGPASVGGTAVTDPLVRALLSQGCANARLDPKAGNALPNSLTTFFGLAAYRSGLASGNVFAGQNFSSDIDTVSASLPVVYKAREDIWEGGLTLDLSEGLQLNYLGSYQKDEVESSQEGLLEQPGAAFLSTAFAPGGFVNDPQLGASNRLTYLNANFRTSEQHFHELRLSSSFAGPFNFSLGGNYLDYSLEQVAGVYSHTLTAFANTANGGAPCAANVATCIYIDPTNDLKGNGHNYFLGYAPYKLKSYAAFGEAYYELRLRTH
ncbi:MAG TPA: TonB-dependent receptor plug domain-containing protein [Novosphingobium sp.]|nr:TonB-dependent receptor plug domain-containing protein [Novosphingobium sp.]